MLLFLFAISPCRNEIAGPVALARSGCTDSSYALPDSDLTLSTRRRNDGGARGGGRGGGGAGDAEHCGAGARMAVTDSMTCCNGDTIRASRRKTVDQ